MAEIKLTKATIIKLYNEGIELRERLKKDRNLRLVYYDVDIEEFLDKCRDMLADIGEFEEVGNIPIPF